MRSKWNRRASLRKPIIGTTITVTIIIVVTGAITVAIAGGVTAIATAVGAKCSPVEKTEAPGLQVRRFLMRVTRSSNQINDTFMSFNIRFYVALGRRESSVPSQHLNISE
jgi:hypothetical protein